MKEALIALGIKEIIMAKISPVSIKYMIHASFKSEGPLERPDVIGAIFGQTEGLLGSDLEMRELQKEGKIGRIEVELETIDGKSIGEIKIPTAMDKSETTLIAASLETIDRIGPTEAKIEIIKIEDVRGSKRDFIVNRAKKLLERLDGGRDFGEMSKAVREETRAAKIQEYGEEKLPAGDLSGNEVIVVEGRADVVNLLKNRVNNVIGMDGTKLPAEIAKLGDKKELTLFIDGDRGGQLIAKNVIENAKVVNVAVAPDGKEVEELTGKEILLALRRKVTVNEFLKKYGNGFNGNGIKFSNKNETGKKLEEVKVIVREMYGDIKGEKSAILLDNSFDVIRKIGVREIVKALGNARSKVLAVVLDGSVSGTLIKACEENGVRYLAAINFGNVGNSSVELISL
jgi:DNA primase